MAKKKKLPNGQINDNKNKAVIKKLDDLMKDLNRNISIKVGIIGDKAYAKHPDTDLTNAQLGAIHEFGAYITPTAKMRGYFWHKWGIHKSNKQIHIPTRSFLRASLLTKEGKKAINKAIKEELSDDREFNKYVGEADKSLLTDVANLVGLAAYNRVVEAFETEGFGEWQKTTDWSKQNRKYNKANPTLVDEGTLKDSVWFEVKEK